LPQPLRYVRLISARRGQPSLGAPRRSPARRPGRPLRNPRLQAVFSRVSVVV